MSRMCSIALVGVLTGAAPAAEITGRVVLPPRAADSMQHAVVNPYPGMLGAMPVCGLPPRSADGVQDAVVTLPGTTAPAPAPRFPNPQLRQIGQSFQPRVLAVAAGTTVDFPNLDPIFHNAFSYSKTKRFDLGKYGQGKSASVTFDKPGVVQVFCDIHASMSAYVFVAPNGFVAQPDAGGGFALHGVPPGEHVLEVWHPERGTRRLAVQVPESGAHVEIAF